MLGMVGTIVFVVLAASGGRGAVVAYAFAPLCFLGAWRALLIGVYPEPYGAKLVSLLFTMWVPWTDIDHFELRSQGRFPYEGYIVRNRSRQPVGIRAAIVVTWPVTEQKRLRAQAAVDRLNQTLTGRRADEEAVAQ